MKRKAKQSKKGLPGYMGTYGDMMTLLLTFFVLLFSMSTVDAEKFELLVTSMNRASISIFEGGQTIKVDNNILQNGMSQFPVQDNKIKLNEDKAMQQELQETVEQLKDYIKKEKIDDQITIEKQGSQIIISFEDVLLFDTGKAELKAGAIPTLNSVGNKLKDYFTKGYRLDIEGHTDNIPIHNAQFPSNWELSSARAIAVMRFYLEEMDFDVAKIACVGKAEHQPVADNDTPEGDRKSVV